MTGLDRLREVVAAMTDAPWTVEDGARAPCIRGGPNGGWPICDMEITGARIDREQPNAAGIVALRNCGVELIAVAEATRELFATVTYKPDGRVLRQLATNPSYARAIGNARRTVDRPVYASVVAS